MKRTLSWIAAVAAMAVAGSAAVSNAAITFNNFGPGDDFGNGGRIVDGGGSPSSIANVDQAAAFTVGPTDQMAASISLGIYVNDSPSIGTGPVDIVLAQDAGTGPGAAIKTYPTNVNSTGKQVLTVTDAPVMLSANTTYWVVMDAKDEFLGSWNFNTIGDIGLTAGRTDLGAWNLRADDERYALRVEGPGVPEPGSLAVLAVGGILAAVGRRRRR